MLLLVSGSTKSVRKYANRGHLGHLLTPANGNSVASIEQTGLPWACDNAAFSRFDPVAFRRMLAKVQGHSPLWIVCPDKVGNAKETIQLWEEWAQEVGKVADPCFVLQDGQEDEELPWANAYFIGGTDDFKISLASADLAEEIKLQRPGAWLHMGRVNSRRRLRTAFDLGCNSFDGSSTSRWGEVWIPKYLNWIYEVRDQPTFIKTTHDKSGKP